MKRALIDWDFAAHGIWIINSPDRYVNSPVDGHGIPGNGATPDRPQQMRPWSDLLTTSLLDRLQNWNDRGSSLTRQPFGVEFHEQDWGAFYRDGRELAEMTQIELGDHWQVLWAAHGAWHFVLFP